MMASKCEYVKEDSVWECWEKKKEDWGAHGLLYLSSTCNFHIASGEWHMGKLRNMEIAILKPAKDVYGCI